MTGSRGITQLRWATFGEPSQVNAQPHLDSDGDLVGAHNGNVVNNIELRRQFTAEGLTVRSQNDGESCVHAVERYINKGYDFIDAIRLAYGDLQGDYAFVIGQVNSDKLYAFKKGSGLVVGIGEDFTCVSSDLPSILPLTRQIVRMNDAEIVTLWHERIELRSVKDGSRISRDPETITETMDAVQKGGYPHFMLKEIHEQPTALADTMAERIGPDGGVVLEGLGLSLEDIRGLGRVVIVACGTSSYAGLVGKYALERWARLPVEVEVASEFRYREPVLDADCLCIAISQSGETADTLAAMRMARTAGARVLAITNIVGSQATREADGVLFTRAGLEIGVAATKTFLAQVLAVLLLALHFAEARGHLGLDEIRPYTDELRRIPGLLSRYLESDAPAQVAEVARRYAGSGYFMCLGRRAGLPVAMEGALKLKEISYVPTEAYAAGEMKHGPIALLDTDSPVLVVATDSPVYDKLISNVQEVIARGARVIAVASEGNDSMAEMTDEILYVPRTDEMLSPLLAVVPLQLFAYHVAKARGEKVDQPRNLAKTVTVE
jgi:glucosamine--fructose-6-phosphate aminotransferase (isomerizing)